jgi:N-acyl-D-amino-acid deacylase
VERLRDRRVRDRLRREWFPALSLNFDEIVLSYVPDADWTWAEGLSVVEAAAAIGTDIPGFLCELFVACNLEVGSVNGPRPSTSEAHMRWLLRHPAHMAGSDGIYLGSRPHPRGWGTFARYLGRHTRDLGDYSWDEAAQHLAARAAQRFGFTDRGVLRPGAYADIAVVNPGTVRDEATYESPRRLARGVTHVLVNGSIVLRDNEPTEVTPGLALRHNG